MSLGIETINLTKKIDKKTVLNRLDLSIPNGNIHGLIGSNGAGKSTTLKILMGLVKPTSGIIRINGKKIDNYSYTYKEKIGYLPEGPYFYEALKIRELLELTAALNEVPYKETIKRIDYCLNLFEIAELENDFIGNLSRGELQRVAICSLMVKNPSIYLLDEPFFSLDPRSQNIFKTLLFKEKRRGSCILIATHLLEYAEKICDSITLLSRGESLFTGKLLELKKKFGFLSLSDIYIELNEKGVKF